MRDSPSPSPPARPHPARSVLSVLFVLAFDAALLALGLGGFGMLVRDPRAIALLVLWGTANLALALLRPVRGQDAIAIEKDPLVMLALFVLPLLTPPLAAWGGAHALWILPYANTLSWLGVGLVALGLGIRVMAMRMLGRRFSPLVAVQREHVLETRGLYAFVRHPGYLGALLSCLGGAIAFGSALALPLAALMLVFQLVRVRREEALLKRHFGQAWEAYARRTGALLPLPRPMS